MAGLNRFLASFPDREMGRRKPRERALCDSANGALGDQTSRERLNIMNVEIEVLRANLEDKQRERDELLESLDVSYTDLTAQL